MHIIGVQVIRRVMEIFVFGCVSGSTSCASSNLWLLPWTNVNSDCCGWKWRRCCKSLYSWFWLKGSQFCFWWQCWKTSSDGPSSSFSYGEGMQENIMCYKMPTWIHQTCPELSCNATSIFAPAWQYINYSCAVLLRLIWWVRTECL